MANIFKMTAKNYLLHLSLGYMANKPLLNHYVKCKECHFDLFINNSYLKRNKMGTTFKMVALNHLNIIFKRRSSLLGNSLKSNFKIDCKSRIKLHLVK